MGLEPSKENRESAVPVTADTVIAPVDAPSAAVPVTQDTVVSLVQDDVTQNAAATVAVGVKSIDEKKERPLSIAIAPPDEGAFAPVPAVAEERTGAAMGKKKTDVGRPYES